VPVVLATIGVAVAVVAIAIVLRRRAPAPPPPMSQATFIALAESLDVATASSDWDRAYDVSSRLARSYPRHSGVIRKLAVALHNRTVAERVEHGVRRPAVRTSLERIERTVTVLALLDSAAALASDPSEWALARQWKGQTLERVGLPLDAVEVYEDILVRIPSFAPAVQRAAAVRVLLENPAASAR
jgi:hypothetical protein